MKVISIGTGQNIFKEGNPTRERLVEYGKLFEEIHVVVFTNSYQGFTNQQLSENVFLYPTNSRSRLFFIFDYINLVSKIINRIGKVNVILSAQDPFETGILGVILKIVYGCPLQIQIHTDFANKHFYTHSALNFFRFVLAHLILPFADSVRSVSAKVARDVAGLNKKVNVLPIANQFGRKIVNNQKDFSGKILIVSRLEKEKNLKTAILVFANIAKDFPFASLTIVGDGSLRKSLEDLVTKLSLTEKVRFVGWQDNPSQFYANADIYLSTSIFEGYGMSVMEAAYNGLTLVISKAGVAEEYFNQEGALVCDPKDKECFYNSLKNVFSDSGFRERVGSIGQNIANQKLLNWSDYLVAYKKDVESTLVNGVNRGVFGRLMDWFVLVVNHNKFLRFLIAGGSVALAQILVLYVLTEFFGLWYLFSSVFSFIFALISSFYLQKYWAFRDNQKSRSLSQFIGFVGVAMLGMLINTVSMYFWVEIMGLWYVFSQFVTGILIAVINFLIYKFIIFKK